MCCDPVNNFRYDQIDGECEKCGEDTVDGVAFDACSYSSVDCDKCGYAPCKDSCQDATNEKAQQEIYTTSRESQT